VDLKAALDHLLDDVRDIFADVQERAGRSG
jgi:hypothetical protein